MAPGLPLTGKLTQQPAPHCLAASAAQFVNIVQAEQLCDIGSDADVLRHVPHARPNWWTDAPHCIMDV